MNLHKFKSFINESVISRDILYPKKEIELWQLKILTKKL